MKSRRERFESFGLAIILAIGAGVLWGLALAIGFSIALEMFFPRVGITYDYEQVRVLPDGQAVVRRYANDYANLGGYYTLDGKQIEVKGDDKDFATEVKLAGPGDAGRFGEEWEWRWRGKLTWSERLQRVGGSRSSERWYFVHDGNLDGHAYFVGYEGETKGPIGYIGSSGFQHDQPLPDEQFPVDGRDVANRKQLQYLAGGEFWGSEPIFYRGPYLLADHRLLRIDLMSRTVKALWRDGDLVSVAIRHSQQRHAAESIEELMAQNSIVLRTVDRVIVLKPDGEEIGTYPIPAELRKDAFTWYQLPDNASLIQQSGGGEVKLRWIDAAGKIARQEPVELHWPPALLARREIEENVGISLIVPSPGAMAAAFFYGMWARGRCQCLQDYRAATVEIFDRFWPFFLSSLIVSIVLAALCYRRQRKYGLPWTPVWTIFVLLFGLPAYFGYLAHRVWPGRLPCPHCGKLVPRDRSACFACGREFPEPALKGTEVFA